MFLYRVRTRHGWGWEVYSVSTCFVTHPFESAINAETFAKLLNEGVTVEAALEMMEGQISFSNGRFYNR